MHNYSSLDPIFHWKLKNFWWWRPGDRHMDLGDAYCSRKGQEGVDITYSATSTSNGQNEESSPLRRMRPTAPLFKRRIGRRLALTTKQVNGGFYKGTGSGSMGWHTKHGGYVIDPKKVRTYVVPEGLKDFKVSRRLDVKENLFPLSYLPFMVYLANESTVDAVCDQEHGTATGKL